MLHKQKIYLTTLIRVTLAKGGNITIYGWRDSNHSSQTREYSKTGRITFVERRSRVVGVDGDLVIFTRFISHADQLKMHNKVNCYPYALEIGTIKSILYACTDLIVRKAIHKTVTSFDFTEVSHGPINQDLNELERILLETEVPVDLYDKFASVFKAQSEKNSRHLVGAHSVSKLLKEIGLKIPSRELIKGNWLVPVVQPGKSKVGWYKAGEKLKERMDSDRKEEPSDPIEKAIFLRERKPFIMEKIAEITKDLEFWKSQMNRVEKAEDLLRQLGEL